MNIKYNDTAFSRLRNLVFMSLLVAIILVLRFLTQLFSTPLSLPGDGSAIRATIVIIGKGIYPKFGSCTIINTLAGILITMVMPSKEGVLTFMKYLTSGIVFDLIYFILKDFPRKPILAGMAGILANLTQLITKMTALSFILGLSWKTLLAGIAVQFFSYVFFGFVFGYAAALFFRQIEMRFQYSLRN